MKGLGFRVDGVVSESRYRVPEYGPIPSFKSSEVWALGFIGYIRGI